MRLVVKPDSFQRVGQRRRELDELVIEERHAALDRRRHAHLVLLHQQLDQVGLHVGVEQAIEQRAAAVRRVEVRQRRAVGALARGRCRQPRRRAARAGRARRIDGEVVEEHRLRRALHRRGTTGGRSGRACRAAAARRPGDPTRARAAAAIRS